MANLSICTSPDTAKPAAITPLRAAHAQLLLSILGSGTVLDADGYALLGRRGLTRTDVRRALDLLVRRGQVRLDVERFGLVVVPLDHAVGRLAEAA